MHLHVVAENLMKIKIQINRTAKLTIHVYKVVELVVQYLK